MATTNIQQKISGGGSVASTVSGFSGPPTVATLFSTGADEYAKVFIKIDLSTAYQSTGRVLVGGNVIDELTIGSGGSATGSMGVYELVVPPSSNLQVSIQNTTTGFANYGATWTTFKNTI